MAKRVLSLCILLMVVSLGNGMNIKNLLKVSEVENSYSSPIIGILTQPYEDSSGRYPQNVTSLTSNYVKFIESVGGRAIPIHYTHSFEHVEELMNKVNGILFTGGDLNLTDPDTGEMHPYTKLAQFIYNKAIEMNENGDNFPIWGTCQGHQLLMLLASEDIHIIKPTLRMYLPDNLNLVEAKNSKLFSNFAPELLDRLDKEQLTYNIHELGIHVDDFRSSPK